VTINDGFASGVEIICRCILSMLCGDVLACNASVAAASRTVGGDTAQTFGSGVVPVVVRKQANGGN
jgi:hypothetical protein